MTTQTTQNTVSISKGNRKMGAIQSVSLPPVVTCKNCATCSKKCYALKLCKLYPTVKASYERNLEILKADRDTQRAVQKRRPHSDRLRRYKQ